MVISNIYRNFALAKVRKTSVLTFNLKVGAIAQLVEQRTENPCVPGSIPGGTTKNPNFHRKLGFFVIPTTNISSI